MSELDRAALAFCAFVKQEDSQALVHTHEQHLLHNPHNVTEALKRGFKREDFNMVESQKEAASLRAQIKALGNINIDAIEQYKEVKEKFDFLTEQKADLDATKEKLEEKYGIEVLPLVAPIFCLDLSSLFTEYDSSPRDAS